MSFAVLSYNVLFNKAVSGIPDIYRSLKPDLVCLQEVNTNEENLKRLELEGYKLSDYSNSFIKFGNIFGVATFYNSRSLSYSQSEIINLPRSIYEFISMLIKGGSNPRTVLRTDFIHLTTKKRLTVYNTHLTAYGTNQVKLRQIEETLGDMGNVSDHEAIVMAGDLNYFPYGRKKLENLMNKHGFKEATFQIPYTFKYSHDGIFEKYNILKKLSGKLYRKLFSTNKIKLDYIFYKNLHLITAKRLNIRLSDHYPIISSYKL